MRASQVLASVYGAVAALVACWFSENEMSGGWSIVVGLLWPLWLPFMLLCHTVCRLVPEPTPAAAPSPRGSSSTGREE